MNKIIEFIKTRQSLRIPLSLLRNPKFKECYDQVNKTKVRRRLIRGGVSEKDLAKFAPFALLVLAIIVYYKKINLSKAEAKESKVTMTAKSKEELDEEELDEEELDEEELDEAVEAIAEARSKATEEEMLNLQEEQWECLRINLMVKHYHESVKTNTQRTLHMIKTEILTMQNKKLLSIAAGVVRDTEKILDEENKLFGDYSNSKTCKEKRMIITKYDKISRGMSKCEANLQKVLSKMK